MDIITLISIFDSSQLCNKVVCLNFVA